MYGLIFSWNTVKISLVFEKNSLIFRKTLLSNICVRNLITDVHFKCLILIGLFLPCILGPSWSWSYGSWFNNCLCNQYLSPIMLWVQTPLRRDVLDTTLCDKVCQWLTAGRWFSPGTPVSSTNKTDRQDITEILLKVAMNTIVLTPNH